MAALEGGVGDALCGQHSGQAAVYLRGRKMCAELRRAISSPLPQLYGTTHTLFAHVLPRQGIKVHFAEADTAEAIERLIDPDTKAVFCESIGNPAGNICDVEGYLAPMVVVFAAMMLLATVRYLHRFDQGPKLDYWLAVYVVALVAGVAFYYGHERGGANWAVTGQPTPRAVRAIALAVGILAAAFAVAGSVELERVAALWPWALTPLTTLVFFAWVGAFAAGLLWVAYDPDRRRTRPVAYLLVFAAALLAAMLVVHRGDLRPDPTGTWAFSAGVAGIGLLGAFMLLFDGRRVSGEALPQEALPRTGDLSAPRDYDALAPYPSARMSREVSHD